MRSMALQKGVVLLSMLAIGAAGLSTRARQRVETDERAQKPEQQKTVATTLEKRIERVESGLLPAIVLKGETPPRMSLNERMKFYRTPGVSVAVINDGKVEWARGYGLLKVQSSKL
jgi:hypothetical protein